MNPATNPPALSAPPTPAPSGVFVSSIAALKNGQFIDQLDDALRAVTEAVNATQLKGHITLKIVIAPNGVGAGDTPVFKIRPSIGKKVPELPERDQSFYADEHYNLCRRHPGQSEMKLELVRGGKEAAPLPEPKQVSAAQ